MLLSESIIEKVNSLEILNVDGWSLFNALCIKF